MSERAKGPGRLFRWLTGPASTGLDNAPPKLMRVSVLIAAAWVGIAVANVVSRRSWGSVTEAVLWLCLALYVVRVDRVAHHAYRSGWWSGRAAMASSMVEASERGEPLDQFLAYELSADLINDQLHDGKPTSRTERGVDG